MKQTTSVLKLVVVCLAVSAVALLVSGKALARPEYLRIYAADPFAKAEFKRSCATCHESAEGGGPRNPFGKAFEAAGFKITPELRAKFPDRFLQPEPPKVSLIDNNPTRISIEVNGRRYVVDTTSKTMKDELSGQVSSLTSGETAPPAGTTTPPQTDVAAVPSEPKILRPLDDKYISLPTGRAIKRNALFVNFSHRFAFNEDRGISGLFGFDGFSTSSFGLVYGITDRIHVGFNRSPATIGRPIEFFGGFQISDQLKGAPVSAQVRVGVEASNNFTQNYVTSISGTVGRSFGSRVHLALTPTVSFDNRPLLSQRPVPELPGKTTFAIGAGGAFRFRPSLAFIIEANQRTHGLLGAHRPAFGFGIQKVTRDGKHAFALTFNNSPGFTTAQRSGTRANLFGTESLDDTFRGLSIGFNITRRLF